MSVIAKIVVCKKCWFEIRDDGHFCPKCGDGIVCINKYQELLKQAKKQ